MKYVMFETDKGQKLPILFPDAISHATMAMVANAAIEVELNSKNQAVSAGFVSLGSIVQVHGKSESLGDLPHQPMDACRIMADQSVEFIPDEMLEPLAKTLSERASLSHSGADESGAACKVVALICLERVALLG